MAVETTEDRAERRIAEFKHWIVQWRERDGGSDWAEATEEEKLEQMLFESCTLTQGTTVPGAAVLAAIERNIDYAGLPVVQQTMLRDLRARLDVGEAYLANKEDLVGNVLQQIVDTGFLEQWLRAEKNSEEPRWSGISEDDKVWRIIAIANESGMWAPWGGDGTASGNHVLETIEREVDYAKLAPWRREGLKALRTQLDRGQFAGDSLYAVDVNNRLRDGLRRMELEATVQDYKHYGAAVTRPVQLPWAEISEEEKLGKIERAISLLTLDDAWKPVDMIEREVDLAAVSDYRRQRALTRRLDGGCEPDEPCGETEAASKDLPAIPGSDILDLARRAADENRESPAPGQEKDLAKHRER
jgi:hypothetical protein